MSILGGLLQGLGGGAAESGRMWQQHLLSESAARKKEAFQREQQAARIAAQDRRSQADIDARGEAARLKREQQVADLAEQRKYDEKVRAEQRKYDEKVRKAGQEFQTGERKGRQEFQTGEREASQEFQTGEREEGQEFQTGEREGRQEFQTGERKGRQEFQTGEREEGQEFQTGERKGRQEFQTGEREGRQEFQTSEREAGQEFQTGERKEGQKFTKEEREARDKARQANEKALIRYRHYYDQLMAQFKSNLQQKVDTGAMTGKEMAERLKYLDQILDTRIDKFQVVIDPLSGRKVDVVDEVMTNLATRLFDHTGGGFWDLPLEKRTLTAEQVATSVKGLAEDYKGSEVNPFTGPNAFQFQDEELGRASPTGEQEFMKIARNLVRLGYVIPPGVAKRAFELSKNPVKSAPPPGGTSPLSSSALQFGTPAPRLGMPGMMGRMLYG